MCSYLAGGRHRVMGVADKEDRALFVPKDPGSLKVFLCQLPDSIESQKDNSTPPKGARILYPVFSFCSNGRCNLCSPGAGERDEDITSVGFLSCKELKPK